MRDILPGEEVCTNYLGEAIRQPSRVRRAQLREGFRFDCRCLVCAAADPASYASREKLVKLGEEILRCRDRPEDGLRMAEEMLELMQQERMSGPRTLAQVCNDGFELSLLLGDSSEVQYWAHMSYEAHRLGWGEDYPMTLRMKHYAQEPPQLAAPASVPASSAAGRASRPPATRGGPRGTDVLAARRAPAKPREEGRAEMERRRGSAVASQSSQRLPSGPQSSQVLEAPEGSRAVRNPLGSSSTVTPHSSQGLPSWQEPSPRGSRECDGDASPQRRPAVLAGAPEVEGDIGASSQVTSAASPGRQEERQPPEATPEEAPRIADAAATAATTAAATAAMAAAATAAATAATADTAATAAPPLSASAEAAEAPRGATWLGAMD